MDNFELDKQAKELSDTYSDYKLARMYLEEKNKKTFDIECCVKQEDISQEILEGIERLLEEQNMRLQLITYK